MPNDDLISRKALLNGFDVHWVTEYDEAGFDMEYKAVPVGAIENAPAVDAEPVIRCGDCENWDTDWTPFNCESKIMHWCPMIDCVTEADFYCAYGKKQEE